MFNFLRKCEHGVIGAINNASKCQKCIEENEMFFDELFKEAKDKEKRNNAEKIKKKKQRQAEYELYLKNIRLPKYLLEMGPYKFEELCCDLFTRFGYEVELTPKSGDGGIDAYLRKDGDFGILQAKRYKGSVGEPVLRDLFGAMHAIKAKHAVVVTTGKVSQAAKKWIGNKPIKIIELEELSGLIRDIFPETEIVPKGFKVKKIPNKKEYEKTITKCPECGRDLLKRKGRYGSFWGCAGYPMCKYTKDV